MRGASRTAIRSRPIFELKGGAEAMLYAAINAHKRMLGKTAELQAEIDRLRKLADGQPTRA